MLVEKMENLKVFALALPPVDQGKLKSGQCIAKNPKDPHADLGLNRFREYNILGHVGTQWITSVGEEGLVCGFAAYLLYLYKLGKYCVMLWFNVISFHGLEE